MEYNNTEKAQHGASATKALEEILNKIKSNGYLKEYIQAFRIGLPSYKTKQFYAPFLITFHDGEKWALYSSTSSRSDRIKGNLWDSLFLKQLDSNIKKHS